MPEFLERTDVRQRMLDAVAQDRVTLDPGTATWSVDGEAVGGWQQRTLVELWRVGGHVQPLERPADAPAADGAEGRTVVVALTRHGQAAHRYWGPPVEPV